MIVTAWKSGPANDTGTGYGVKLAAQDRDRHFVRTWETVTVEFDDSRQAVEVNIDKDSFWNDTCRELISKEIGRWILDLIEAKRVSWPKRHPPKFTLTPLGNRRFKLSC